MNSSAKPPASKVCSKCGDVGYSDVIATCSRCKKISEHIYCMKKLRRIVPEAWCCEECSRTGYVSTTRRKTILIDGENAFFPSGQKVKTHTKRKRLNDLSDHANSGLISHRKQISISSFKKGPEALYQERKAVIGSAVRLSPPKLATKTALTGKKGSEVLIKKEPLEMFVSSRLSHSPMNGIMPRQSNPDAAGCLQPDKEEMKRVVAKNALGEGALSPSTPNVRSMTLQNKTSANLLLGNGSCNTLLDGRFEKSGCQSTKLTSPLLVLNNEYPNRPVLEANWKGDFEVVDTISHVYHGLQAHTSGVVSIKVYEVLKCLPQKIKFKLCRRLDVWPKTFHLGSPTFDDIGLYIFPSEVPRLKESYSRFVEMISKCNLVMQSFIGDVELLIFPSSLLPKNTGAGSVQELFMWGIFQHLKSKRKSQTELSHCSEGNMAGCSPVIRMENIPTEHNTPPGFFEPICRKSPNEHNTLGFPASLCRSPADVKRLNLR